MISPIRTSSRNLCRSWILRSRSSWQAMHLRGTIETIVENRQDGQRQVEFFGRESQLCKGNVSLASAGRQVSSVRTW
jgi:hypothetical protein